MLVLLHGEDDGLEQALHDRALEVVREGQSDALLTVGPAPRLVPLAAITAEQWRERMQAWMGEPFWVLQAWLRDVLRRGVRGRWIAVTTGLGAQPFPGGGADGAGAVALQTLVRVTALEYGSRGIRANAIAAGWRVQTLPADLDRELAQTDTPTGRLSREADLAGVIAWLLSDDAEQLNGETLNLDGGYTITRGSRADPRRR